MKSLSEDRIMQWWKCDLKKIISHEKGVLTKDGNWKIKILLKLDFHQTVVWTVYGGGSDGIWHNKGKGIV